MAIRLFKSHSRSRRHLALLSHKLVVEKAGIGATRPQGATEDLSEYNVGDTMTVEKFESGAKSTLSRRPKAVASKVVKRWGFAGDLLRTVLCSTAVVVLMAANGQDMSSKAEDASHMGAKPTTQTSAGAIPEKNLILIRGSFAGGPTRS